MEKRIPYYVSRKNALTWISALLILASVVFRCILMSKNITRSFWLDTLPVLAGLLLIFNIIIDGKNHLYRAGVPGMLIAVYFCVKTATSGAQYRWIFLACIAYIAIGVFFAKAVNGRTKGTVLLGLVLTGALALNLFTHRKSYMSGNFGAMLSSLPDACMLLGGICLLLSMQIYLDDKYHPTWGDRSDGRKLRTLNPITIVANFIMPTRNVSDNHIADSVEITEIEKYISRKRKEGYKGFGINHIFLAAHVRAIAKYPGINRFYSGQQIYQRDDDIQFCMVVKAEMSVDGEESVIKLHLKPTDTIIDIYNKLQKEILRVKEESVGGSNFDKTAKMFSYLPRLFFRFAMGLINLLDYFGLLPEFLLEVSPFHGSVFFTSMASLGIPPIMHHLYDFGNLPVFYSIGTKRTVNEIDNEGKVIKKKYIDYIVNTDERIVDGFYYATVLKYVKKLLAHPEKLELPPEEVIRDID